MFKKQVLLYSLFLFFPLVPSGLGAEKVTEKSAQSASSQEKGSFGKSFILKGIKAVSENSQIEFSFEFAGSDIPELKKSESLNGARKAIKIEMNNTLSEVEGVPELPLSFSHFDLISETVDGIPKVTAWVYLNQSIPVELSSKGKVLNLKIQSKELPNLTEVSLLHQFVYQAIDENILVTKMNKSDSPLEYQAFLINDKKGLVVYFQNAKIKDALWAPPEIPNLTGFQSFRGKNTVGVPYVKLIYTSRNNLDYNTREDDERFFIDLLLEKDSSAELSQSRENLYESLAKGTVSQKDSVIDETSYLEILKVENPELYERYVQKQKDEKSYRMFLYLFFAGTVFIAYITTFL